MAEARIAAAVAAAVAAERAASQAALEAERARSDAARAASQAALEAERARSDAARASAQAALEAERARSAAIFAAVSAGGGGAASQQALAALRLGGPPPRRFVGVAAALAASGAPAAIPSPSKADAALSILGSLACVDLCAPPLSLALAGLAAGASLSAWAGVPADALLHERAGYSRATRHVPRWVTATSRDADGAGSRSAAKLFLDPDTPVNARPTMPGYTVPWSCYPELFTAPSERFHPAFNGELKSAMSKGDSDRPHMFDELVTYALLGMLASYFRDVPAGVHRFFRAPPHAFSLAAFPHVGYLLAVEWAGKLLVSAVSEPFFLGSERHCAAVASLPDSVLAAVDVHVGDVGVSVWSKTADDRAAVIWRVEAPVPPAAAAAGAGAGASSPPPSEPLDFFKIIRGDAFPASFFRGLAAAYAGLAAACADARDPPPSAIVHSAELLFGAGEVCVRMPWVRGREAVPADLREGGVALSAVATAIVWLARHRLLYIDVREPNVIIDDAGGAGGCWAAPRVALVDYDDMVVIKGPLPTTAAALCALLAEHGAAFAQTPDVPGARPALIDALERCWSPAP